MEFVLHNKRYFEKYEYMTAIELLFFHIFCNCVLSNGLLHFGSHFTLLKKKLAWQEN